MLIEPNLNRPDMLRRNTMYDEQAKNRYYKEKLQGQDDVAKKLPLAKNIRLAHPREPRLQYHHLRCFVSPD